MKMKFKTAFITALSGALCAIFLVTACSKPDSAVALSLSVGNVAIHTGVQAEYLADDDYANIAVYAKGTEELSRPEAVRLEWSSNAEESEISQYTVEISATGTFSDVIQYSTTQTSLDVYNLCVGATYHWRVVALSADGSKTVSQTMQFTTDGAAPRNMYVEGVTNMRDLGGWDTVYGGKVRQGMIYRCGRLNESETTEVNIEITQEGIDVMRDILGIRTEIDLRSPDKYNTETGGITSSPLGEDIKYFNCPMAWATNAYYNYLTAEKDAVLSFFDIVSVESNYPLIFHCNIGTDRTGFFAYLINGLLGVDEEDLYRDYLFSNFGNIGGARQLTQLTGSAYVAAIAKCAGDTLSEKIENCLLGVGVPQYQLDAVRSILTEN